MKKYTVKPGVGKIYASEVFPTSDWNETKTYAHETRKDEIEFEEPQIFSIQFYTKDSDLLSLPDREILLLANSYDEANALTKFFCKKWRYPYDKAVVQFAYLPPEYWDIHKYEMKKIGSVEFIPERYK